MAGADAAPLARPRSARRAQEFAISLVELECSSWSPRSRPAGPPGAPHSDLDSDLRSVNHGEQVGPLLRYRPARCDRDVFASSRAKAHAAIITSENFCEYLIS